MMLEVSHKTHELEFVILKGKKKASLLGLKASILLGLVRKVHIVDKEGIVHNIDENADVFQGIGKLQMIHT